MPESSTNLQQHWERAYLSEGPGEVSWYQVRPAMSLEMIRATAMPLDAGIIDVGGGASTLVDGLLAAGYSRLAVLDLSASALGFAKARLGDKAATVEWLEGDVTSFKPPGRFGLWHDRAVFHFLTAPEDRARYVEALKLATQPSAHVILATFAPDGPERCSGLPVRRYDSALIASELGDGFELIRQAGEVHVTPWQSEQKFNYFQFKRRTDGDVR